MTRSTNKYLAVSIIALLLTAASCQKEKTQHCAETATHIPGFVHLAGYPLQQLDTVLTLAFTNNSSFNNLISQNTATTNGLAYFSGDTLERLENPNAGLNTTQDLMVVVPATHDTFRIWAVSYGAPETHEYETSDGGCRGRGFTQSPATAIVNGVAVTLPKENSFSAANAVFLRKP